MKYFIFIPLLFFSCVRTGQDQQTVQKDDTEARIITMGGTITEIVHSLGLGDAIVATDKTSTYPAEMQNLPSVGYRNGIKAEGILSLSPTLVLVEEGYLMQEVISQLQEAKVKLHLLPVMRSVESTFSLIESIGSILDKKTEADELKLSLQEDLDNLSSYLNANKQGSPSILFVFARGKGSVSTSGTGTFAEQFIAGAGGKLALPEVEGTRPLSTEALLHADPDFLLFFTSGIESIGGMEGALELPGVRDTKAGSAEKIIAMDGNLISGFGPRVGQAMLMLAKQIHPPAKNASL